MSRVLRVIADLNSLVDTSEGAREVLHSDIHVLELSRELLPFIIAERGEIEVDKLGREARELVVETDAVVSSHRNITLLILGGGFPGVGMDHLHLRVPHSHPNSSITSLEHLVADVEGGALVDILPVAVLLASLHMDLVLHGDAGGRVQRVLTVKAGWRRWRGGRSNVGSVTRRKLRLLVLLLGLLLLLSLHLGKLLWRHTWG